jgi:hypothetical protein
VESSVIKEFLVALGFKSDEAALKKFENGITQATKVVFGLAAAIESTAVGVAIGVSRFASNLETLYFATLKTGSSATNLRVFDRAARDFGVSAGEAQESVQGLARFLRMNPGGEGALASWFGVKVIDASGKKRDMVDVLLDIGRAMQAMPQWQAQQRGNLIGLSEDTIRALQNGDFEKNFRSIYDELKKAGFGKAADDAHAFMVNLRKLGDQVVVFGTQIYEALQSKFKVSLETLTEYMKTNGPGLAKQVADILGEFIDWFNKLLKWLEQHGPQIAKFISEVLTEIRIRSEQLKPVLEWVFQKFKDLDDATGGWSTKLLGLAFALKVLGAGQIVGGVLSLAAAFVKLAAGLTGLSTASVAGGASGIVAKLLARLVLPVAAGVGLGWGFDKLFPNNWLAQFGENMGGKIYDATHHRENALLALTNMGWKREQAEGIINSLNAESALNPHAEGDGGHAFGIAQWHEDRQAQFEKMFGHSMRAGTGDTEMDLLEQLRFLSSGDNGTERGAINLARAADSEAQTREVMVRQYLRPADPDGEIIRASPTISQETNIHIDGRGEDAAAIARAVAFEQSRVNAAIVREFSNPVQ